MNDPDERDRQLRRIRTAAYAAVAAGATLDEAYAAAREGVNELHTQRLAARDHAPSTPTQRPASDPATGQPVGDEVFDAFRVPGPAA